MTYSDVLGYTVVICVCVVLVCFHIFGCVDYPWLCLSVFMCDWVCQSKFFDVVVCLCMLFSLTQECIIHGCISLSVPFQRIISVQHCRSSLRTHLILRTLRSRHWAKLIMLLSVRTIKYISVDTIVHQQSNTVVEQYISRAVQQQSSSQTWKMSPSTLSWMV